MKTLKTILFSISTLLLLTSCDPMALTGGTGVDANGRSIGASAPVEYGHWTDLTVSGDGSLITNLLWMTVTQNGETILFKTNIERSQYAANIARSRFGQAFITFNVQPLTIKVNGFVQQNQFRVYAGSEPRNN